MSYDFDVRDCEDRMKNYFRGVSGRNIKDTLFLTIRNTGVKPWGKFSGSFKCVEEQSNYFFEAVQIPQDVYPGNSLELVLNFPRIEKNSNKGNVYSSIQLVYKEQPYTTKLLRFRKDYDLVGNDIVEEGKVEIEEDKVEIEEGKVEIEEQKPKEEKKPKEILEPYKLDKKEDDDIIIVKKFRSAFDFSKADFSDEYILDLLKLSKNDFQKAMMIHLDKEDLKKEEMKQKSKSDKGLNELVEKFRQIYQLSKEDYSDDKIKTVLAKKQGNFENAFEELMSFIE